MGLLYKIITADPEFLSRLRKYLRQRGANNRTYFYFLATLKSIKDDAEQKAVLKWLVKEGLIDEGALALKGESENVKDSGA